MSLTIGSVIASETRRGVLLDANIDSEVTDEVRAMIVYHHEWARDLDPGYPGLVCLMFVGTADRGLHCRPLDESDMRDARYSKRWQLSHFGNLTMTILREQVLAFHKLIGAPSAETPVVPSDDRIRLRRRLIKEEFFEFLVATSATSEADLRSLKAIENQLSNWIDEAPAIIDMVETMDALGDMDYVIEGTRIEFGVNGEPIAAEIHRANMTKCGGPVRADGKAGKPQGWLAPDIAGELRKQGWPG